MTIWTRASHFSWDIFHQALRWRHNDHDSVSNHQPHGCLLNLYSDADQRKHQRSASLAFVLGNSPGPVNSPHKGPVTRKMFPFDDVIMGFFNRNARWISPVATGKILCITTTGPISQHKFASIPRSFSWIATGPLFTKQSGRSPKVVKHFSTTNYSSYIIELLQLHDTIQIKWHYTWIHYNIAIRNHLMI